MPKLSFAKLERHPYAAADHLLQEGLDAATYKDYTRRPQNLLERIMEWRLNLDGFIENIRSFY